MTAPRNPRAFLPHAFAFATALHVAAVLAFAIVIAAGCEARVVLAIGITVAASVAWARLLWRARTEHA